MYLVTFITVVDCAKGSLIEPDFHIVIWGHVTKQCTVYTQLAEQNARETVYERPGSG